MGLLEFLHDSDLSLRPPEKVMHPTTLGSARLTRLSFSRSMIRRAASNNWKIERTSIDLDECGRGQIIYRVEAEDHIFHFVAFTTTIDESLHTDRVIADGWEISAALVEGELSENLLNFLATEVPKQETSRLDSRVLSITRGNRSVRFYEYLVNRLASGFQPEAEKVGDAGYIMRSTAFYGNGKFGMRSFLGFPPDHPLAAPYRAQFLAAWLFRETSYDSVEYCAQIRSPEKAVAFDEQWCRFFGLGNATGLGLIPWAMKHPKKLNAWVSVRELALAGVRALPNSVEHRELLEEWIEQGHQHFASFQGEDRWPWMGPDSLSEVILGIRDVFSSMDSEEFPFDALYLWAEEQGPEITELVVSLLLELDETSDDEVDRLLRVDNSDAPDLLMTVGDLNDKIAEEYFWLDDLDLESSQASHYWWVISDNAEEPRRAERSVINPEHRDVAIDFALRLNQLKNDLKKADCDIKVTQFLQDLPHHGIAVNRTVKDSGPYSEPRENVCDLDHLPLNLQRFQLAMYGMDNFKAQSTDWLRVTLFQGAPRIAELCPDTSDRWVWPQQPQTDQRSSFL
ncbi:MAG TPA: hypothetical protein QF762_08280 [Acidimicrobiales bacterium]|nr:hypothetical protein [Acidimicrobiales bacterium]